MAARLIRESVKLPYQVALRINLRSGIGVVKFVLKPDLYTGKLMFATGNWYNQALMFYPTLLKLTTRSADRRILYI